WVVDMFSYLIEHPRWIPADRLSQIDVRAGADTGRIYRVYPRGKALRPIRDLGKIPTAELAWAMDTPNGTERDRVHLALLSRHDNSILQTLETIFQKSRHVAARLQALCAMDGLAKLIPAGWLEQALQDKEPAIRSHAIRLS